MCFAMDDDGSSFSDEWEVISTSSSSSPTPKNKEVPTEITTITPGTSASPTATPTPLIPIMPGWKDEYLTSLLEAEKNSPVNQNLVEACKPNVSTTHALTHSPPPLHAPLPFDYQKPSQLTIPSP